MTCKQAQKRIYVYHELGQGPRAQLDRHMATCASCRLLLEHVIAGQTIAKDVFRVPEQVPDAAVLTNRIMNAVENANRPKQPLLASMEHIVRLLLYTPVRYAMATLSLLLILAFIGEYNATSSTIPRTFPIRAQGKTELNSQSFIRSLNQIGTRPKTAAPSFYECLINCVELQDGDCSDCGTGFRKLKDKHENS